MGCDERCASLTAGRNDRIVFIMNNWACQEKRLFLVVGAMSFSESALKCTKSTM
jgi:hypothetical protein